MRTTIYMLCAAMLLAAAGCDRSNETSAGPSSSQAASEKDAPPTSAPTAKSGQWKIGAVDVRLGQSPGELDLPAPDTVRVWLEDAVSEVEPLAKTDARSEAFLMYQAAVVDGVSGVPSEDQPLLRIRVQGRLDDPSRPAAVNKLMALGLVRDRSLDVEDGQPTSDILAVAVREVVQEYVRTVARRFEALSASEDELVGLLKSDALPPEAALTAIHEARDRQVDAAVSSIAALLRDESPSVVVAAAAALSQMAPDERADEIVEAAGRLGREREYASLHRLIFIVGDLEQPVAREYLEGLTGHQIPDIRRAAEQALKSHSPDVRRGQP